MGCFLLFYVYKSLADVDPHILSLHTDIKNYMKAVTPLFLVEKYEIFYKHQCLFIFNEREIFTFHFFMHIYDVFGNKNRCVDIKIE